ncbi:MAG: DEAD/DEAH box helicase family protein [Candidatus Andersenbacteria bacterium]|nr:DEAD/DEAH box helicase family protein [Candidatus Andersenbacteria bacterium]
MSSPLSYRSLKANWPYDIQKFSDGPRDQQDEVFRFVGDQGSAVIEGPTGMGKGAVAYVIITAAHKLGGQAFWIVPTKALVQQFKAEFPGLTVAYGRNEYACAWAAEDFDRDLQHPITAQELVQLQTNPNAVKVSDVATMVCHRCPHYVDPESGDTNVPGVPGCPYYVQKHRVRHADRVLCTMSFYLYRFVFLSRKDRVKQLPATLVIDEVHRLPKVVRYSLSYDITDYHLSQSIEVLERLGNTTREEVKTIKQFRTAIRRLAKARGRRASVEALLEDDEIHRLIEILEPIDADVLANKVKAAITDGLIRPKEDRAAIKRLEVLVRDIRRYVHAFMYSTDWVTEHGEERRPLNYTCSFYRTEQEVVQLAEETGDLRFRKKVTHKLVIHAAHVASLIRKCLLAPITVGLSATIGNEDVFQFITGINFPILRLASTFPADNRRIYAPTDTPSLAFDAPASRRHKTRMLRQVTQSTRWLSDGRRGGFRSLVVVVSEEERQKFIEFASQAGLTVTTYGNGIAAKDAAADFKEGEGVVLLGTSAHYAEGIDLPDGLAPVIFLLRPGFPNPSAPEQQFRLRRFGKSQTWKLNWYDVCQQVNQTAGRNIRSETDLGVIVLIDRRFRRYAFASLPKWLEPAYRGELDWDACLADTVKLLKIS